jgi:hypothetical protein
MNGTQFAVATYPTPAMRNTRTTATLMATIMLLKRADSRIPRISSAEMTMTMPNAGRLNQALTSLPSGRLTRVPGAAVSSAGIAIPILPSRLLKYPDQPTATVEDTIAYSRIRSQPMIQAMNSPSVA